ncbi:hypothetical protein ACQP1W_29845 [Spirillospora sp. CA-255316]
MDSGEDAAGLGVCDVAADPGIMVMGKGCRAAIFRSQRFCSARESSAWLWRGAAVTGAMGDHVCSAFTHDETGAEKPIGTFTDALAPPIAATVPHRIAGKWTSTQRWFVLNFTGRIPFPDVQPLYRRSMATVLLAADRLATRGQFRQRLPEAVLAGCLPIAPAYLRSADRVVPEELISTGAGETRATLTRLPACWALPSTPT